MNSIEFIDIRRYLGKSQAQIARLLGISPRAVQSFEQNWRKVPALVERQMLFLVYMKLAPTMEIKPCWEKNECDLNTRNNCPAWEFQGGHICWFINGTICGGKSQENWKKKMQLCQRCDMFTSLFTGFRHQ